MPDERVTVLGAGVIGLTAALRLAESGYIVTVVARDLPGDSTSQQFASPWAGADWHSFTMVENEPQTRWEAFTFKKIWSLIPSGVAMKLEAIDYYAERPEHDTHWFKDLCPDYRVLDASELPQGLAYGLSWSTWSVDAPRYIQWLEARLKSLGVTFVRATVQSIEEPFLQTFGDQPPASVVVNATALGARSLVGVEDELVHPIRGQTVLVWAPHFKQTIGLKVPNMPPTYIIPRPSGEVILGGTYLVNDWDLSTDPVTTKGIIERSLSLAPSLAFDSRAPGIESLPIIKVNVGLRPAREGGARLEHEEITVPLERGAAFPLRPRGSNITSSATPRRVDVVHAYGAAGAGFQASWGMAEDVLELVRKCFEERSKSSKTL